MSDTRNPDQNAFQAAKQCALVDVPIEQKTLPKAQWLHQVLLDRYACLHPTTIQRQVSIIISSHAADKSYCLFNDTEWYHQRVVRGVNRL
jgi:hypothetical protein